MMVRSIVGMLLGAALGALVAGSLGGVLGAVCGAGLGLLWGSVRPACCHVPANATLTSEKHKVVCIPRGEVADCVLLRDAETGAFVDVESCSLEPEGVHPRCLKRCLDMLPRGLPHSDAEKPAEKPREVATS